MGYYEVPPIETFDVGKWAEEEIKKIYMQKSALAAVEEKCKSKIHSWPENMLTSLPTATYNFQIKDLLDLDTFAKTWNGITNDTIEGGRKAMKKFNDTMGIKGTHQDPLNQKEVEEEYWEFDDLVKRIVFNPPATIVFWFDGTKTVVKCGKDQPFNPYYGFCAAVTKRMLGHNCAINRHIDEYVAQMDKKAAKKYEDSYLEFNNKKAIEKLQENFRKELEKSDGPEEPENTEEPKEIEYECYDTTWEEDSKLERYCDTCAFDDYDPSDDPCKKCLHCNEGLKVSYYKKAKYNKEDSKNG